MSNAYYIKEVNAGCSYKAVKQHCKALAEYSSDPLLQRIDDGLVVLGEINATTDAMHAFCLHPIFQADKDLATALGDLNLASFGPRAMALVMEYRSHANAWLPDKVRPIVAVNLEGKVEKLRMAATGAPTYGPLEEVHHMLIASIVPRYKAMQDAPQGSEPLESEMAYYYGRWLSVLDVDGREYRSLCAAIDAAKAPVSEWNIEA